MARQVEPPSGGIAGRILLGIVVLAVVWIVLQFVLGMVFAVVRAALLDEQGADANHSEQRVELIRKL